MLQLDRCTKREEMAKEGKTSLPIIDGLPDPGPLNPLDPDWSID
jgi:hypothetical protein